MDDFETVILGGWCGRVYPPGAKRTHAVNVGSGIQQHHAGDLRQRALVADEVRTKFASILPRNKCPAFCHGASKAELRVEG